MFQKLFVVMVAMICLLVGTSIVRADYPSEKQERATIKQESGGNVNAVGDKYDRYGKLKPSWQWSYGDHQIGWRCVADFNKKFGTHYKAEDCKGNPTLSKLIYREYVNMHATQKSLGHKPTDDDMSGIWNGGPCGWKSRLTVGYRQDVRIKRNKL